MTEMVGRYFFVEEKGEPAGRKKRIKEEVILCLRAELATWQRESDWRVLVQE